MHRRSQILSSSGKADVWIDVIEANRHGDFKTVLRLLKPLAERGNVIAQTKLGVMYEQGQGVPRDNFAAIHWFIKAAKQGNANAQTNLGVMFKNGQGVAQNYTEARNWFRKAARQGDTNAQYELSNMYVRGIGIPANYVLAYMWISLASTSGDVMRMEIRSSISKLLTPSQLHKAQKLTDNWLAKFENNVPKKNAGSFESAETVYKNKNYNAAFRLFKVLAKNGDARASNKLGMMYQKGLGVPLDQVKSFKWIKRSAHQGNIEAQRNLGMMYAKGRGVTQNYTEAVKWTKKAAERGDAKAQFGLGVFYYTGQGLDEDPVRAHMWINIAASTGKFNQIEAHLINRLRRDNQSQMTKIQIAEAQKLARKWVATHEK